MLGRHLIPAHKVVVSFKLAGQECRGHVGIQGKLSGQGLLGELSKTKN